MRKYAKDYARLKETLYPLLKVPHKLILTVAHVAFLNVCMHAASRGLATTGPLNPKPGESRVLSWQGSSKFHDFIDRSAGVPMFLAAQVPIITQVARPWPVQGEAPVTELYL